ncbi:MAG: hypothetical protein QXI16_00505 [Sulfolobaceae archaeon]
MKHKILITLLLIGTMFTLGFNIKAGAIVGQGEFNTNTFNLVQNTVTLNENYRINGLLTYTKRINTQNFSYVDYYRIFQDKAVNDIEFTFYIEYFDSEGANDMGFTVYPNDNMYDFVYATFSATFNYADGSKYTAPFLDYGDLLMDDWHAYNIYAQKRVTYVDINVDVAFSNFGEDLDIQELERIYLNTSEYYPTIFQYEMVLTNGNIDPSIISYNVSSHGSDPATIDYTIEVQNSDIGIITVNMPDFQNWSSSPRDTKVKLIADDDSYIIVDYYSFPWAGESLNYTITRAINLHKYIGYTTGNYFTHIEISNKLMASYQVYFSTVPNFTSEVLDYMSNITITQILAPYTLNLWNENELYYTSRFSDNIIVLPLPPIAPVGYEFIGWAYVDGSLYNGSVIEPYFIDETGTVNLYAKIYRSGIVPDIPDNPEGTLDNGFGEILNTFKLNNVQGLRIVYVVVALVLLFAGIRFFKNVVLIALLEIAWLGLAMFMGIVDLWIVIIIGLVTALVIKLKVGD